MSDRVNSIQARLTLLTKQFDDMAQHLLDAATVLLDEKILPPPELVTELATVEQQFAELRATVLVEAERLPTGSRPDGAPASLQEVEFLLQSILAYEQEDGEEARRCALTVLDRVRCMIRPDQPEFPPLHACREQARILQDAIAQVSPSDARLRALAEGMHPFCQLLQLVEQQRELDDVEMDRLFDSTASAFDPAIARVAARGRLAFAEAPVDLPPHPRPDSQDQSPPSTPNEGIAATTEEHEPAGGKEIPPASEEPGLEAAPTPTSHKAEDRVGTVDVLNEPNGEASPGQTSETLPMADTAPAETTARDYDAPEAVHVQPATGSDRSESPVAESDQTSGGSSQASSAAEFLVAISPDASSQMLAAVLLDKHATDPGMLSRELVWQLLAEERTSLALHFTCGLGYRGRTPSPLLPAWALQAFLLAPHVRHADGDLALLLENAFASFDEGCFTETDSAWNHAVRFLLVAAALRPALLAPGKGAAAVIHGLRLKDGLTALHEYCEAVAHFADTGVPLDPSLLYTVQDREAWQTQIQALREESESWFERAPKLTTAYAPATQVWQAWCKPNGIIQRLLSVVRSDDPSLQEAQGQVSRLSNTAQVIREVNAAHRGIRGGGRNVPDIRGTALEQILGHTHEAVGFVRRWIALQNTHPSETHDYFQRRADQLRVRLQELRTAVYEELTTFHPDNPDRGLQVSKALCRYAVESVQRLFESPNALAAEEVSARFLLGGDLLRVPSLTLSDALEPEQGDTEESAHAIVVALALGLPTPEQAFEAWCERRDHHATQWLIEQMETIGTSTTQLDELRLARERSIQRCREALQRDLVGTRDRVEGAVTYGLLTEEDRGAFLQKIEPIEVGCSAALRFEQPHQVLEQVRTSVAARESDAVQNVRQRLEQESIPPESPWYARITAALDRRDVLTANEYIDAAAAKRPLPTEDAAGSVFAEFFPARARDLENYMPEAQPRELIQDVRQQREVCGITWRGFSRDEMNQTAQLLNVWFTAKRQGRIEQEALRQLLTWLGFRPLDVGRSEPLRQGAGRRWIDVTTEPIRDRLRCPVPKYGSDANGHYRVLCVWDRLTLDDLLADIGPTTLGPPVMVFYFNWLTEPRRYELARLCREQRRTFIVLDQILLMYLCGATGSRLPALFQCTLPFTYLEPYTTTAGLVPPEMFYGRQRELESIIDPRGACFIFGGRQLGKTALLRHAQRTFHDPARGHIAIWIDLKTRGIGANRPIDDLWRVLDDELREHSVVPSRSSTRTRASSVLERLQGWLKEDDSRRVLLLLDEADNFLEFDGRETSAPNGQRVVFARCEQLKGLMDSTERRFKIVLAGLHNVLRTTNVPNHPLGHLQKPICIGPLLDNTEFREARALVEDPLASLGYLFESPDLVTRVLSLTNYYPNLIQIYCQHLLQHVTQRGASTLGRPGGPPHTISSEEVNATYRDKDLQGYIRERFKLTLQLDPRYHVIAHAIALGFFSERREDWAEGFSLSWLQRQALDWWEQGFRRETSADRFRALVDEMVGLGVLRPIGANHFTLRSPNVVLLMGTKSQIEEELLRQAGEEPPLEYEPATFRAADSGESSQRSPLTALQVSKIEDLGSDVLIIFGNRAAGVRDLRRFLKTVELSIDQFDEPSDVQDLGGFRTRLLQFCDGQKPEKRTILYTSPTCPWTQSWVEYAVEQTQRRKRAERFRRIVFVADPTTTWQLVGEQPDQRAYWEARGVPVFFLDPWDDGALRQWLGECGFGPTEDVAGRQRITAVTGNWRAFLLELYEAHCQGSRPWEQHLAAIQDASASPEGATRWAQELGTFATQQRHVLRIVADLGNDPQQQYPSTSDVVDYLDGELPAQSIHKVLAWAGLLSLVRPVGNDCWRTDPTVARVLQAAPE
jgi:hypothetical protein